MRLVAIAVTLLAAITAQAGSRKTVAVLEYRAGAKGAIGIGERLAQALAANAALDVIGPQEARRRAGQRIDADVARCAGEPMCIGALGETLGAQEVLLIGVSQLGDVVLAMQRIDARRGTSGARLAESMPPDAQPLDDEILNWLKQLFPPEVFKRYGSIKIMTDVRGADVRLNDESRGKSPIDEPLRVRAPGSYKVRVTKSGYAPFEASVDVLPDATVEMRANLVRLEGKQAWYKRWYVWAAVGGALAIAGASVGIYYGTRVDETPMGFIVLPPRSSPP